MDHWAGWTKIFNLFFQNEHKPSQSISYALRDVLLFKGDS